MLYAQTPARRSRQILSDVAVLCWVLAWVAIARWLDHQVLRLAAPGRSLEDAGRNLAGSLDSAGRRIGDLPFAGDALQAPFTAAGDAGRTLEHAGAVQQHAVGRLAFWLSFLLAALPILFVVGWWLVTRLRWSRRATAAASLKATSADLDLFALRALARQPLAALHRIAPDPAEAWRRRDPATVRALARLELRELGLDARD